MTTTAVVQRLARQAPPARARMRAEVLGGLLRSQKELPPKLFYDERGSQLFDQICELEEYYPTRTELAITRASADEIATLIGPGCLLVEYGSGSSVKTRLLLERLVAPAGYVPVDISHEHLLVAAGRIAADYPGLEVLPVAADYTVGFALPVSRRAPARVVTYFPGSTIGNLHPREAVRLLHQIAAQVGIGGGLLIGVDLQKDRATLERAYNDAAGVTAAFNLNLLARLNRDLDTDFQLEQFQHRALYNERLSRIEMHLVSLRPQLVRVGETHIAFAQGEHILTECSYKYTLPGFAALAWRAGFTVRRAWTDAAGRFSVQYLTQQKPPHATV